MYGTTTIALLNQDLLIMYLWAPVVALLIYLMFKLVSLFKW